MTVRKKAHKSSHRDNPYPQEALDSSLRNAKGFLIRINSLFDGTPSVGRTAEKVNQSLDQLIKHRWSFSPYLWIPLPSTRWQSVGVYGYSRLCTRSWKSLDYDAINFSHFAVLNYKTLNGICIYI